MEQKRQTYSWVINILSGLTALAGVLVLVDYFSHPDEHDPDPFWVVLTTLQVVFLVAVIVYVNKHIFKHALWLLIGVVVIEVVTRVQGAVELMQYYPNTPEMALSGIPIVGLVALEWEWSNPYSQFLYWFLDITAATELISLVLLILLVRGFKVSRAPEVVLNTSCPSCGAENQKGNFCAKCGNATK